MLGEKQNPDNIKRRERVFANDLENIPFHTAIFWGAFVVQAFANLSDYGKNETLALTALFVLYCFFRLTHTLTYVFALQPMRTISFILANLCVGITVCVMTASAFNTDTGKFYSG